MTIDTYISTYGLPDKQGKILKILAEYYKAHNGVDLTINLVSPGILDQYGASYQGIKNGVATINLPPLGQNGRVPVKTVDGKITYVMYDSSFGYVHEVNHLILDVLGLNTEAQKRELNIAVMAKAVEQALVKTTNDEIINELKYLLDGGWSITYKNSLAQQDNASFENIYSTKTNFSSKTGISQVGDILRRGYGQYGNWEEGSGALQDALANGMSYLGNEEANVLSTGVKNDYIDGGDGDDTLYGDANDFTGEFDADQINGPVGGNDVLIGGSGKDTIYGGGGDDTIYGDRMGGATPATVNNSDTLIGGTGTDTIYGGIGDDILIGGIDKNTTDTVVDQLEGGDDDDTYYAGDLDTIKDSDGKGSVYFEGEKLSGGTLKEGTKNQYEGDGGTYTLSDDGTLKFEKGGKTLFILNYDKEQSSLRIKLTDGNDDGDGTGHNQNHSSPLVLDLDGDGQTSEFIYSTDTHFDIDGDGYAERTAWIDAEDGLLAFDKNQNGTVDDGTELFGNYTDNPNGTIAENGFEALANYDENSDGVIDAKDNIYSQLSVWTDANQDGVTDAGELKTLSELNITSISIDATEVDTYEENNQVSHTSTFTQTVTDGEGNETTVENSIKDVWFLTQGTDSTYDYDGILSDTVAALPDFKGSGRVMNLSHAMNEDSRLETAVTDLLAKAGTATYAELKSDLHDTVLPLWTKTENISAAESRGEHQILNHNYANPLPNGWRYRVYAYARDVAVLEAFRGEEFTMTVDGETTSDVIGTEMAAVMKQRTDYLENTVLATLLVEQLYGNDAYDVEAGSFDYDALFGRIETTFAEGTSGERQTAAALLATLVDRDGLDTLGNLDAALLVESSFVSVMQSQGVTYSVGSDGVIAGSYGGDTTEGTSGADTLYAVADGTVYGGDGNDVIYGSSGSYVYDWEGNSSGHEVLHGGAGDDVIYGAAGSDMLYGGEGNDTLYANSGSAYDSSYGNDYLIGGEGDDTLVGTKRDTTYIYNWGDGNDTIIDGGNVGVTDDILELRGIRWEDVSISRSGSDMVLTITDDVDARGNGSITIKDGFDSGKMERLVLDDRTVTFDLMVLAADGLVEDDVYTFGRGSGRQSIFDSASLNGDTLKIDATVDEVIIKASADSDDLVVALAEEGKNLSELSDILTITDWFKANNRIEFFEFSDGTVWEAREIVAAQGTDEADTTHLLDDSDNVTLDLGDGDDVINTGAGDDVLTGGAGDDTLSGGGGDDTYFFGIGDGNDTISDTDGSDRIVFGDGITADRIVLKFEAGSDNLLIGIAEEGKSFDELSDTVTLTDWFKSATRVETFEFADGTIWTGNDIVATVATEEGDIIRPENVNQSTAIHLLGGDDIIVTGSGDDAIYGDGGDDTIRTSQGSDTLAGGVGDDTLEGGSGDDTYLFDRGDGSDTIYDASTVQKFTGWRYDSTLQRYVQYDGNAGTDTLRFGAGITAADIVIKVDPSTNDMVVALKEEGKSFDELSDRIVLTDWFDANNRVETFAFEDGTTLDVQQIIGLQGTDGSDTLRLINNGDAANVDLGDGDDTAVSYDAADTIDGGAGDDLIQSGKGDDTLIGGAGTDRLEGGAGDDIYVFGRGDGSDTIYDASTVRKYLGWQYDGTLQRYVQKYAEVEGNAGTDTLRFGAGITADDIVIKVDPSTNDMVVALKEEGKTFDELSDRIVLTDWFDANQRIEVFEFEDGTTLDVQQLIDMQGTDGRDTLRLINHGDAANVDLGDGDDTAVSYDAADTIDGGAGDDLIQSGKGDDTLIGGAGTDRLEGGAGDDTYVFGYGSGSDVVVDVSGSDAVAFADGITTDNVVVTTSPDNDDLVISLKDSDDTLTITDWFDAGTRIETLRFADGTELDVTGILGLQNADADANFIRYAENDDTLQGFGGADTLAGGAGDDVYVYGRGDGKDIIFDLDGTDTIRFEGDITADDIDVRVESSDGSLLIGIKEDGKDFEALSDIITIRSGQDRSHAIEYVAFSDGTVMALQDFGGTYTGTEGDDVIPATGPGGDIGVTVDALGGDDTITFGDGMNVVDAGAGDDVVALGDGDNTVITGQGNDEVYLGNGNNRIGVEGYAYVEAGHGDNEIVAYGSLEAVLGDGDNKITAYDSARIEAGSGNNTIAVDAAEGSAIVHTGAGSNAIDIAAQSVNVVSGGGTDTVTVHAVDGLNANIDLNGGGSTVGVVDGETFESGGNVTMTVKSSGGRHDVAVAGNGADITASGRIDIAVDTLESDDDNRIRIASDDATLTSNDSSVDFSLDIGKGNNDVLLGSGGTEVSGALVSLYATVMGSGTTTLFSDDATLSATYGLSLDYRDYTEDQSYYGGEGDLYIGDVGVGGNDIRIATGGAEFDMQYLDINVSLASDGNTLAIGDDDLRIGTYWMNVDVAVVGDDNDVSFVAAFDNGLGESVYVDIGLGGNGNRVEALTNADVNVYSLATDSSDDSYTVQSYSYGDETIIVGGNQSVVTGSGNDTVSLVTDGSHDVATGEGDDFIELGSGNDFVDAGSGDDTIATGDGDDVVRFGIGDGSDKLTDTAGKDVVRFGEGITKDDLNVTISFDTEFRVDSAAADYLQEPAIATLADGGCVVTWSSYDQDGSGYGVFAQAYNADGSKAGEEMQVNTYTSYDQSQSAITALADGGYVITWYSYYQDGSGTGIYMQRYDADGVKVGGETQVNTYTSNSQFDSAVTALADGGYVVTWQSYYQDGSGYGIYAQRYDADGVKVGSETQVNTYTSSDQREPSIAALADGGYVITWNSYYQDGSSVGIYAQRYDADGAKVGDETQVNTYTSSDQVTPAISALADGGYVVTWQSYYQDGSGYGIYAQRYDADGVKVGSETQVNTYTSDTQSDAAVTALADGGYVIVWQSYYQDGSGAGIYAQRYDADGAKVGDETQVNTYTSSDQVTPAISALADGGYVVTWQSYGEDGSSGIYAKRFDAEGNAVTLTDVDHANLVISLDGGEQLVIRNWFADGRIESFEFADGTVMSDHEIVSLIGSEEAEIILGTEGDNVLDAEEGDDVMAAGAGDDTYRFGRGSGHDVFRESEGFDTIAFGDNIVQDDLILQQEGNDLVISVKEAGKTFEALEDTIVVSDWFDESGRIERFRFADGSTMELDAIYAAIGADGLVFYGTPDVDVMDGGDGTDVIMALESGDTVDGHGGNDLLFGQEGDDTLTGGAGNDLLYGGSGDDRYIIGFAEGDDRIFDSEGGDTLSFTDGVLPEDVTVIYDGDDLLIALEGTTVRVTDWYKADNRIETFAFTNGEVLDVDGIVNLQHGAIKGVAEGTIFTSDESDDVVYGQEGDDVYTVEKGAGDDVIIDAGGRDTLAFAEGIGSGDLTVVYDNDDLIVSLEGTNLRLTNWYDADNRIETFAFADGSTLDVNGILNLIGTAGDDTVKATELDAEIVSLGGDDTLIGGNGNDTLEGGEGDDTYDVGLEGGADTVIDVSGSDRLRFTADITPEMVRLTWLQGSDDVLVTFEGQTGREVVLKNWYDEAGRIETFEFADGTVWEVEDIIDAMGSEGDDVYNGLRERANIINGRGGADIVSTFEYDDVLYGGAGEDALDSRGGDDMLVGGAGDDMLLGGAGDDVYYFERGFGHDLISESDPDAQDLGNDTLLFGAGITFDDILVKSVEDDDTLYIGLKEDGKSFDELSDVIAIENWYVEQNSIESIALVDGGEMSIRELLEQVGDETRAYAEGGDIIGTPEVDTLVGNVGDDVIMGLEDDDTLLGKGGDDLLEGGKGDDRIEGGGGNDVYVFNLGDGNDTIYDGATAIQERYGYVTDSEGIDRWQKIDYEYSVEGGTDTIYFGEGISPEDLVLTGDGNDLHIGFKDAPDDGLTITDYYKPNNTIEFFVFDGGETVWDADAIDAALFTPEDDDVTLTGDTDRTVDADSGDDTVTTGAGDDILTGSEGDDTLNGGLGDDTYRFGRGDGHDTIHDSGNAEWWQGSSGNDALAFIGGLTSDDILVRIEGDNVILALKEAGKSFDELEDSVTIENAFDVFSRIETVAFDDGTTLDFEALIMTLDLSDSMAVLKEDEECSGTFEVTNPGGGALTYEVVGEVSNGAFTVDAEGNWSYIPDADYNGSDAVTVKVTNAYGLSTTSTLTFEIEAVNDVPVVVNEDEVFTLINTRDIDGRVEAGDPDGDALTYFVSTQAEHGTVSIDTATGDWAYSVGGDYLGTDTAVITVDDGNGGTTTQTLYFDAQITPPIVQDYTLDILEDQPLTISLPVENLSGGTLSYAVATAAGHGTVTIDVQTGEVAYAPDADYNGSDTFSLMVTDAYGQSAVSQITMMVEAVNDVPEVVEADVAMTLTNVRDAEGRVDATDVDGDVLAYTVSTQAQHGVVSVDEAGNWHYKADGSYNGSDTATITVDDGNGGVVTATLNFTIEGYIYEGTDLVIDDTTGDNTLAMGDISKSDLVFTRSGDDLLMHVKDEATVTFTNYYTDMDAGVETIQTAEGTISLSRDVSKTARTGFFGFFSSADGSDDVENLLNGLTMGDTLTGGNLDDVLFGYDGMDTLEGLAGNDLLVGGDDCDTLRGGSGADNLYGDNGHDNLYGDEGDDTLVGGSGSDHLYGGTGNDILHGGVGNDTLKGESGDDVYMFHQGDGDDDIYDHQASGFLGLGSEDAGFDTIRFGEGITKDDLSFTMNFFGNLEIQYGDNDFVTVHNQDEENDRIERIEFSDGSYLSSDDIDIIVQQINACTVDVGLTQVSNAFIKDTREMMQIVTSAWHTA